MKINNFKVSENSDKVAERAKRFKHYKNTKSNQKKDKNDYKYRFDRED